MTDLAERLREPQRVLPVVFARAEAAWLAGELPSLRGELAHHLAAAQSREDVWRGAQLHFWLRQADPDYVPPLLHTGPYAMQLRSTPRAAAARLAFAGQPVRSSGRAARRLGDGRACGADRLPVARCRTGCAHREAPAARPRCPDHPARATAVDGRHPFGLTSRQNDVLVLLAEDLTNKEIAARLVVVRAHRRPPRLGAAREAAGPAHVGPRPGSSVTTAPSGPGGAGPEAQGWKAIQRSSSAAAAPESTDSRATARPAAIASSSAAAQPVVRGDRRGGIRATPRRARRRARLRRADHGRPRRCVHDHRRAAPPGPLR